MTKPVELKHAGDISKADDRCVARTQCEKKSIRRYLLAHSLTFWNEQRLPTLEQRAITWHLMP